MRILITGQGGYIGSSIDRLLVDDGYEVGIWEEYEFIILPCGGLAKLRDTIKSFIIDNFMMGRNPQDLMDSDSLLNKGIIDSTGVLELVGFIEEKFGLQVDDEELVPENLDSVDNLINYIQRKKR